MALAGIPGIARAECQATSADVSWVRGSGAEACPSAAEIRSEVVRRIGKPIGAPGEGKVVEVTIEKTSAGWSARIVASGCSAERAVRELTSEALSCESIASAAALVIALAIDPQAAMARPVEPEKSEKSAPAESGPESRPTLAPVENRPTLAPVENRPTLAPVESRPTLAPVESRPTLAAAENRPTFENRPTLAAAENRPTLNLETRLTLGGALTFGLLPVAAPGFAWSGELRFSRWIAASTGVLFMPEQPAEDPTFEFGMTTGWIGACSDVLRLFDRLSAGPCVRVLAGSIHAIVHAHPTIIGTGPGQRAWVGGGAGAHLTAHVAGPLVVEVSAQGILPFTQYAFVLRDALVPVFRQAPVAGLLHIGAGLAFP